MLVGRLDSKLQPNRFVTTNNVESRGFPLADNAR
jgi:hypothetical protein